MCRAWMFLSRGAGSVRGFTAWAVNGRRLALWRGRRAQRSLLSRPLNRDLVGGPERHDDPWASGVLVVRAPSLEVIRLIEAPKVVPEGPEFLDTGCRRCAKCTGFLEPLRKKRCQLAAQRTPRGRACDDELRFPESAFHWPDEFLHDVFPAASAQPQRNDISDSPRQPPARCGEFEGKQVSSGHPVLIERARLGDVGLDGASAQRRTLNESKVAKLQ